jgi:ribosomal subunit interface protein
MPIPLQITFRKMDPSPAVEERIRKKVEKLERFHDRIVNCSVVVEAPHRHHHKGKLYTVRVDISVPGKDVVVDRAKPVDHGHEDVYVAIRDAFNAAVRRLEDQTRKMRGDVKTHAQRTTSRTKSRSTISNVGAGSEQTRISARGGKIGGTTRSCAKASR